MFVRAFLVGATLVFFMTHTYGYVLHTYPDDFDAYPYQGMKKSMLSENRLPKASTTNKVTGINVQMLRPNISGQAGSVCEECKTVVQEIADTLKDKQAVARYKRVLKLICIMATGRSVECDAFVDGVDTLLESLKEMLNDPNRVCHELHLCGQERPNIVSRMFLLSLKSFNFEMQASQKGLNSVDILCDECLFMVNEMAAILSDPAYQKSLEEVVKKLCDVIPQVRDECKSTIDAYAPAVFQEILEYLANPKPFCQKVGFCKAIEEDWYPMTPLLPANMNFAPENQKPCPFSDIINANGKPNSCLFCEFLANAALEYMKDDRQLNLIEESVMSMCFSLPSEWAYSCVDWIGTYLKPSVLSILTDANPKSICNAVHACTGSDRLQILTMSATERQEAACDACKAVTEVVRTRVQSPQYHKAVEEALKRLCDKSPISAAEKCQLSSEMYVKKIKALASRIDKTPDTCSNLGVCPSAADRILWL